MKLFEIVTIIGVSLISIWVAYGYLFESKIDTPHFNLIKQNKEYSIRQYPILNVVSTTTYSDNESFRKLFKFIDGNNSTNTKIAMTAPVITNSDTMMFVLPKLNTIPKPNTPSLQVSEIKNITVAVIPFSGSSSNALRYKLKLESFLQQDSIKVKPTWYLSQYNSPWVFPLLRKNEIWIELDYSY